MTEMKTLGIEDVIALKAANGGTTAKKEKETALFQADDLHVVATDREGNVVLDTMLTARGFAAKKNNKTGETVGGIGWYSGQNAEGVYRQLPVNCGLRISVAKVKLAPNTPVDFRSQTQKDLDIEAAQIAEDVAADSEETEG